MFSHPLGKFWLTRLCCVCKLVAVADCLVERPICLRHRQRRSSSHNSSVCTTIRSVIQISPRPTFWHLTEQNQALWQRLHFRRSLVSPQLAASRKFCVKCLLFPSMTCRGRGGSTHSTLGVPARHRLRRRPWPLRLWGGLLRCASLLNALRSGLHSIGRANARRCKCNADLIRRIALCHNRLAFTFITGSIFPSSEDASPYHSSIPVVQKGGTSLAHTDSVSQLKGLPTSAFVLTMENRGLQASAGQREHSRLPWQTRDEGCIPHCSCFSSTSYTSLDTHRYQQPCLSDVHHPLMSAMMYQCLQPMHYQWPLPELVAQ